MKQIVIGVLSGLATAAALFAQAPAHAEPIDGWVAAVNKKLDRSMAVPANGGHGVAEASFERGEDGRPKSVTVLSGNRAVARAARTTLARVRDLPPLPTGYKGARIKMQMLVGDAMDAAGFYFQRKQMLAVAQANNARLVPDQREIRLAALDRR